MLKPTLVGRLLGLGLALAAFCGLAHATSATLAGDASVNSTRMTTNYGAISNLYVGNGNTSLLQFDLSSLPDGTTSAQIAAATLRFYVNRVKHSWHGDAIAHQHSLERGNRNLRDAAHNWRGRHDVYRLHCRHLHHGGRYRAREGLDRGTREQQRHCADGRQCERSIRLERK